MTDDLVKWIRELQRMTPEEKFAHEIDDFIYRFQNLGFYRFHRNEINPELFDALSKMDKVRIDAPDSFGNVFVNIINKRVVVQQLRVLKKLTLL
jgi:hypothetical protein